MRPIRSATLEVARVSVDTEDLLQHLHLLAHARVAARAFEEGRHQLGLLAGLGRGRRLSQALHGLTPPPCVARLPHLGQTSHLLFLYLRIDLKDRYRRLLLGDIGVDADDELLLGLDLLLEAERRVRDLTLRIAALDR